MESSFLDEIKSCLAQLNLADILKNLNNWVPISAVRSPIEIGSWVSCQRKAKKGAGSCKMTIEQESRLEAIPGWRWDEDSWFEYCALLEQYIGEMGKMPTQREIYNGVKIGTWISNQRRAKKGTGHSKMTPEREARLEAIPGWRW